MNNVVAELIKLLDLENIEENLFRGHNLDIGSGIIFGGQVISQALIAAFRTLPSDRYCHSLHAYFLRPGDLSRPIIFNVERIRDGKSFTTRRITAIQHGHAILNMSASFQLLEQGHHHEAIEIPSVPSPETLESDFDIRQRALNQIKDSVPPALLKPRAIDIRPINPVDFFAPEPVPPRKQVWFQVADKIIGDVGLHQALLAYASDFGLVGTGLLPHGLTYADPQVQVASIDHTLWFHAPFLADEWLLYDMDSPYAGNARNFNRGQIFQNNHLVASVCQEGLMRVRD